MGAGVGAQVGLGDDDDMQRLRELLMEQVHLVDTGLHMPLHRRLFEVLHGEVGVIHLVAILAMRTSPSIGARVGEVQRGIVPQLGNQMELALPGHLQGVVVAEVPVEHHIGQRDHPGDQLEQGVEPAGNPPSLRRAGPVGFGLVLAALGPPRPTLGARGLRLLGGRCGLAGGLLRVAAHHRLDAQRKRAPGLDTHERQSEERSPWDGLTVQARKEAIQTMGARAGFGDDDVIARDEVDVTRTVQIVPEEDPKQEAPRDDGGEKALDGAIAAAFAGPAGHAEHGDASGHYQERTHYLAALAQGACWDVGLKALQECYNVHCGLLVR